ncbi:MAG: tripartite tricarboxylate transporter substrate binding protein [Xanthobacteraceae bacterium]|nr:tripartite tricarboxylate transporter substrate binding protein [Xanthobacteraceae bacterium]
MLPRRHLAAALAALAVAAGWTQPAAAQSYPNRVIKLVVPFTPGSPNDVMARLLTQHLSPRLGQPIVIDNKPGGGTTIGTKLAAAAEPDGYTLLFISSAIIVDPAMKGTAYDPRKEFAPVATVNTAAWLVVVSPALPVRTMAEFVAHTKAHPGTVNFAATQGTAAMLVAERFKQLSGADLLIVPYKGGAAALPDFLGGRIQVLNPTPSTSLPLIRDGKMRPLMITSPARSAELPDVPTAREAGLPELTLEFWAGVMAPAGTPPEIVGRVNAAINDTLRSPEMRDAMAKLGFDAKIGSPQDYARFIAEETPRWTGIAKAVGVKAE